MNRIMKLFLIFLLVFIYGNSAYSQDQLVNPVVAITGTVVNSVTHEPVTVFIVVLDENGKRVSSTRSISSENGYYYLPSLKPGKRYSITVNNPDYCKEKFDIFIPNTIKYLEISKDFQVTPLKVGTKMPFDVPPFEYNKSKLRFGVEEFLGDIRSTLVNNPTLKFQIICYPDSDADKTENAKITEERANALLNYFSTNGIDKTRIIAAKGSATTDPKNPPPTQKKAKGKRYIGTSYIQIDAL